MPLSRRRGLYVGIGVFIFVSLVLNYEFVSMTLIGLRDSVLSSDSPAPRNESPLTETEFFARIRLHPEALFELESLELGNWTKRYHATELHGVIRPTRVISWDLDFVEHSYFEVLLQGPATTATEATWSPKTAVGDRWTFVLLVPSPGKYEVHVNLVFGNFSSMFKDHKNATLFVEDVTKNREAYPIQNVRPISQGIRKLVVPNDSPVHFPSTLRLCNLADFEAFIPGYWVNETEWFPFQCQLPELNPTKVLSGLWVHYYGDSNPRKVFSVLCGKGKGELAMHKSKIFHCIGPDFVLTYAEFWAGHSPTGPLNSLDLRATIKASLNTTEEKSFSAILERVPSELRDQKNPNFVILHPGSHTAHRAGPTLFQELLELLQRDAPSLLDEKRLIVSLTPATCIQRIPSFKIGQDLIQNNMRFKFANVNTMEVFEGKTSFVDYYSVSLPLAIACDLPDAIHFRRNAYQIFAHLVLQVIQANKGSNK